MRREGAHFQVLARPCVRHWGLSSDRDRPGSACMQPTFSWGWDQGCSAPELAGTVPQWGGELYEQDGTSPEMV